MVSVVLSDWAYVLCPQDLGGSAFGRNQRRATVATAEGAGGEEIDECDLLGRSGCSPTIWIGMVGIFLLAPLVVVVIFAFDASARLALPYPGLSFRWFNAVFSNSMITASLFQSLKVGLAVGALSIVVGYTGARLLLSGTGTSRWLVGIAGLPTVFPILLSALGLAILVHKLGLQQGTLATVIGQTIVSAPFATLVIAARLRTIDSSLLEASRDLGASQAVTFRRVTFPLVRGALLAAGCFAMALSLDEFLIAFFNSGSSPTLPVVLWGLLRSTIDPTSNAVATIILAICCVLVYVAVKQMGEDVERL